ncbi:MULTISPECIES: septation protein A [Chromobacterium]|uniref:Inner membrane-spanning protein YciB n=2 Tax=Chromobacterium TaxID=535 RepID=A0ABS3GH72_9NEIS|nr:MULTISPECIES: septation protein A [Chromobacterium]AXT46314.1 septation protein A [Chromobacterium rhizoryzae]MBK0413294.1 septation protein A [Chromobacterium haemolyticum]MBO0414396.1 septation protein A [Chromobacterium haemolyticum]MBO0497745.1 septation protein A [Chromobacterium haemolyticum]MDH0340049.1 septation protein A [Chromobacterium haemolyticum]
MKFFTDLFPVVLFFATYWLSRDMFIATGVAIVATTLLVGWTWLRHRKVDTMQWVSLGLIVVLGGATLLLHDKHFIMWKPTVLYWVMGAGLLISDFLGKNGLKLMMGQQLQLPAPVWRKLTWAWVGFFAFMGALNLFVAYRFSEDVWVNFKLFGGLGLMLAFVIAQSLFLSKYIEEKK